MKKLGIAHFGKVTDKLTPPVCILLSILLIVSTINVFNIAVFADTLNAVDPNVEDDPAMVAQGEGDEPPEDIAPTQYEVKFSATNAHIEINGNIVGDGKQTVIAGEDITFSAIASQGYEVKALIATNSVSNNVSITDKGGDVYSISKNDVDDSLVVTAVAEALPVAEPPTPQDTQGDPGEEDGTQDSGDSTEGEGGNEDPQGTSEDDQGAVEGEGGTDENVDEIGDGVMAAAGIPINSFTEFGPFEVDGALELLSGETYGYEFMVSTSGIQNAVMFIPFDYKYIDAVVAANTSGRTSGVETITSEESEKYGIPAGKYLIVEVPRIIDKEYGSGLTTFTVNFSFKNGETPKGQRVPLSGYIVEGEKVANGNGIVGGTVAVKDNPVVASNDINQAAALVSDTNEVFSLTKTVVQGAGGTDPIIDDKLSPRSFNDINKIPSETYDVVYNIELKSSGNESGNNNYGRINQEKISIDDIISRIPQNDGKLNPIKIKVTSNGNTVELDNLSADNTRFTIPVEASDANGFFKDQIFKVVVTYDKDSYTKKYRGESLIDSVTTINNEVTLNAIDTFGNSFTDPASESPAQLKANADVNIGFVQNEPGTKSLELIKQIKISGQIYPYTNGNNDGIDWIKYYGFPTFTLTGVDGPGEADDPQVVSINPETGTLTFGNLKPYSTYTLTEEPLPGFNASFGSDATITVGVNEITVEDNDPDATAYDGDTYTVTNISERGYIKVDVSKQIANVMTADNQKEYASFPGAVLKLYNSTGNEIGEATSDANGIAYFHNVPLGTGYKIVGQSIAEQYPGYTALPEYSPVVSSSGEVTKYEIKYDTTYGGIKVGKRLEYKDRTPFVASFNATFTIKSKTDSNAVPYEFTLTDKNTGLQYIKEALPAGDYTIEETKLVVNGKDVTKDDFEFFTGEITVSAGEFGATLDSENNTNVEEGFIINKSKMGQIKVVKEDLAGNPLSGFAFNVMSGNTVITTLSSGKDQDSIAWVPVGTYDVVEIEKDGYGMFSSHNTTDIVVTDGELIGSETGNIATFVNGRLPKVTGTKISSDSTGALLGRASFRLYKLNAEQTTYVLQPGSATSSNTGEFTFSNVSAGEYILVETTVPTGFDTPSYLAIFKESAGFIANVDKETAEKSGAITFNVDPKQYKDTSKEIDDNPINLGTITNVPLTTIKVKKLDAKSGAALSGATFGLYESETGGDLVTNGTMANPATISNKDSGISFANLKPGTYWIGETAAPNGYFLRGERAKVTISPIGEVTIDDNPFTGTDIYANSSATKATSGGKTTVTVNFSDVKNPIINFTKTGETNIFDTNGNRVSIPMAGAEFIVSFGDPATYLTFTGGTDGKYVYSGMATDISNATKLISPASGDFSIEGLDYKISPTYNLKEIAPPTDGIGYENLIDATITITQQSTAGDKGGISEYTTEVTGDNVTSSDAKVTMNNKVVPHYLKLEKFNLIANATGGGYTESKNAFNAKFSLEMLVDTDELGNERWELVDTLITGTANAKELNTAISKQLAAGKYRLVEESAPEFAYPISSPNYQLFTKDSADAWQPQEGNTVVFDIPTNEVDGVTSIVLGNAAGTGGSGTIDFVRLKGDKLGYKLSPSGEVPEGALMGVTFDVYRAWIEDSTGDAKGIYHQLDGATEPFTTVTTGMVFDSITNTYKPGSFITEVMRLADVKAGAPTEAKRFGFILVESGGLPHGYQATSAGNKFFVEIDLNAPNNESGMNIYTGEGQFKNYAGTGQLEVIKKSSGTNATPAITFEVFSSPDMSTTNMTPVETYNTTSNKVYDLPAGYYYIKETSVIDGTHNIYGKYKIGTGEDKAFKAGDLIGPIAISGNEKTALTITDDIKPNFTIYDKWNGVDKSTWSSEFTVSYKENESAQPVDKGSIKTVNGSWVNTYLDDGIYTFKEIAGTLNTPAGENEKPFSFINNAEAMNNGIVVVVKDAKIDSIKVNGTQVADSRANSENEIWGSSASANVNRLSKGALIINMGHINYMGVSSTKAGDDNAKMATATFSITPVNGDPALEPAVWKEKELWLEIPQGIYEIKQTGLTMKNGAIYEYKQDSEYAVYVEIKDGYAVYLQNNKVDENGGNRPADQFTKANVTVESTRDNPLKGDDNYKNLKHFYNAINLGELKVVKYDKADNKLLGGATFGLFNKQGDTEVKSLKTTSNNVLLTNSNGTYTASEPILPGDYYVKEITAPSKYDINPDNIPVTVLANTAAVTGVNGDKLGNGERVNTAVVGNSKLVGLAVAKKAIYPEIIVGNTKISEAKEYVVSNILMKLYKEDSPGSNTFSEVDIPDVDQTTWFTDEGAGVVDYGNILGVGKYRIVESIVLDAQNNPKVDYVSLNKQYATIDGAGEPVDIIVAEDPKVIGKLVVSCDNPKFVLASSDTSASPATLTIENDFIGILPVAQKLSYDTPHEKLSGAEFKLYRQTMDGTLDTSFEPLTATSDDDGLAIFKPIYPTDSDRLTYKYFIEETKAPKGYILSDFYGDIVQELKLPEGQNKATVATFYNEEGSAETDPPSVEKSVEVLSDKDASGDPTKPLDTAPIKAKYTITQGAFGNKVPVNNYIVTDNGLRFSGNHTLITNTQQPTYKINEVFVGKTTAMASAGEVQTPVYGQVKSFNKDGVSETTNWLLLEDDVNGGKKFNLIEKAVSFEVYYSESNDPNDNDCKVGAYLTPGVITYTVDIDQFVQDKSKDLSPEVDTISNAVLAGLDDSESGRKNAVALITVPKKPRAQMAVSKTPVDKPAAGYEAGGTAKYELKLENTSPTKGPAIVDPIVIDHLEQLDSMYLYLDEDGNPEYKVEKLSASGAVEDLTNKVTPKIDDNDPIGQYVYWKTPAGTTLEPGDSIRVTVKMQIAAIISKPSLGNAVLGTSAAGLKYSSEYPSGAQFTVDETSGNSEVTDGLPDAGERGLYARAESAPIAVAHGDSLTSVKSIGLTADPSVWVSSSAPISLELGEVYSYQLKVQNNLSSRDLPKNYVITDTLPINGQFGTTWSQEDLLNKLSLNKDSLVVYKLDEKGQNIPLSETQDFTVSFGSTGTANVGTIEIRFVDGVILNKGEIFVVEYDITLPLESEYNDIDDFYKSNARKIANSEFITEVEFSGIHNLKSNIVGAKLIAPKIKVRGVVWEDKIDANDGANGYIDSSEFERFEGVKVDLYQSPFGLPTDVFEINRPWTLVETAYTNDDGEYSFNALLESSFGAGDASKGGDETAPVYKVVFTHAGAEYYSFTKGYYFEDDAAKTEISSHVFDTGNMSAGEGDTTTINLIHPESVVNAGLSSRSYKVEYLPGDYWNGGESKVTNLPSIDVGYANKLYATKGEATLSGYTFVGWEEYDGTVDGNGSTYKANDSKAFTMPANDVKLIAKWVLDGSGLTIEGYHKYYDGKLHNVTVGTENPNSLLTDDSDLNTSADEIRYYVKNPASPDKFMLLTDGLKDVRDSQRVWAEVYRDGKLVPWEGSSKDPSEEGTNSAMVEIVPVPVLVTTEGGVKVYDGQPLTAPGAISMDVDSLNDYLIPDDRMGWDFALVDITPDADTDVMLVNGEMISAKTTGTQTEVGDSENTYAINWKELLLNARAEGDDKDMPANYIVHDSLQSLFVTSSPDTIIVSVSSIDVPYNGQEHVPTVTVLGLDPELYVVNTATTNAKETNANQASGATVAKCDTLIIDDMQGNPVPIEDVFTNIQYSDGNILVRPLPLNIETNSATKTFDGEALTAPGTISGFITGESADLNVAGTQTAIGSSENIFELTWNNALEVNYTLNSTIGTLTVTGVPLTPTGIITSPTPTPLVTAPGLELAPLGSPLASLLSPLSEGSDPSTIGDLETPRAAASANWALLNLMLAIVTVLTMITLFITFLFKRKDKYSDNPDVDENVKKHLGVRLVSILVAIIAVVVFIITEDMRLPMIWVDRYTIWMAIILLVQLLVAFFSKKKYLEEEVDTENGKYSRDESELKEGTLQV